MDLLADLFSSSGSVTDSKQDSAVPPHSIPAVNLFGDVAQNKNNVKSAAPNTVTNANLLDDLFGPGPSMTVGQEPIPPSNVAANQSSNMVLRNFSKFKSSKIFIYIENFNNFRCRRHHRLHRCFLVEISNKTK